MKVTKPFLKWTGIILILPSFLSFFIMAMAGMMSALDNTPTNDELITWAMLVGGGCMGYFTLVWYLGYFQDKEFWKSREELDKMREAYRKSKDNYNKVRVELNTKRIEYAQLNFEQPSGIQGYTKGDLETMFNAGDKYRLYLDKNATGLATRGVPSSDEVMETMSFEAVFTKHFKDIKIEGVV